MSSKYVSEDFLLSSTPVQSPEEDSGYFGSNEKRNFYALNTFSPVKDLCFNLLNSFSTEQDIKISHQLKCEQKVREYEDFVNEKVSQSEHLSENVIDIRGNLLEQEFLDISFSNNAESQDFSFSTRDKYNEFELFEDKPGDLSQENFIDLNKLNSASSSIQSHTKFKKSFAAFKQSKIDFLHSLNEINCLSIISSILSFLSPSELCIARCVNKEWKQIVQSDFNANNRWKNFIKERNLFFNGPYKENRLGVKCPARQLKKAFSDLTNCDTVEQPLLTKHSNSRFDSFLKERENGHLKLHKCPKCCYASKSLNEKNYKCTKCSYIFCSSCLDPVFKNHSCNKSLLPKSIIVGSKKSKKNLKRL